MKWAIRSLFVYKPNKKGATEHEFSQRVIFYNIPQINLNFLTRKTSGTSNSMKYLFRAFLGLIKC